MIGKTISHFRILDKIGEGGMGVVYRAFDEKLHRHVALKVLPPAFADDADRRARFIREARAAAAVSHPNIAGIHEIDEEDGVVFIAMELVEGRTLRQMMGGLALPPLEAVGIASQIAAGLERAHRAQVIHRDLKPENIIVGPDGHAKILDFGLARLRAERREAAGPPGSAEIMMSEMPTTTAVTMGRGLVSGTPAYMSPEQARGQSVDPRSDLFSLGVILYEMVTGARPFRGLTTVDTLSAVLKDEPAPASRGNPEAPVALDAIISRCLAKERENRYASAAALRSDLDSVIPAAVEAPAARRRKRLQVLVTLFALIMAGALALRLFGPSVGTGPGAPGSVSGRVKSLAVLPLKPIGGGEADGVLGLGIADTIITKVSQIGSLAVRPTSAVRKYASGDVDPLAAARELQVESVLEGSVQRSGDRMRVNVNLLRAIDGTSLMAESFEMGYSELFAIQDRVAREVASRLKVSLNPAERERLGKRYTESPLAYEHYLRGQQAFDLRDVWSGSRSEIETAIASFSRAVEIDPNYALARAALAHAYVWLAPQVERGTDWIERAEAELENAGKLDPALAEAHIVRGDILWSAYKGWKIAEAIREFRIAASLNPSVGHAESGTIYYHLGLEEPALRELHRAEEIDPHGRQTLVRLREGLVLLGHLDEAIALRAPSLAATTRTLALIWKGRLDEAEASLLEDLAEDPNNPYTQSTAATLLALRGRFAEAESRLGAIVAGEGTGRAFHHVAYACATVYALEGKARQAVTWLGKTAETGMPNYPLFARDPHLDRIRSDPGFLAFMAELKPRWEEFRREAE